MFRRDSSPVSDYKNNLVNQLPTAARQEVKHKAFSYADPENKIVEVYILLLIIPMRLLSDENM